MLQKAVVCDVPAGSINGPGNTPSTRGEGPKHGREVVAFVGGIDLTVGRYDNGSHKLFPTDDPAFKTDWYIVRTRKSS